MRFRRRLMLLYVVFCAGLGLVWLRAGQLQIVDGDEWEEAARDQRRHTQRFDALRGAIISADGVVLAEDVPVFQLVVRPLAWKYRDRAHCTGCGAIYFRSHISGRMPEKCGCRRMLERGGNTSGTDAYPRDGNHVPGRLEQLEPGDVTPLETVLGLEPGELARRADARLARIEHLVEATRKALTSDGDVPPFLKERLRMRKLDLMKRPFVLEPDLPSEAVRLVETNENGRYRGLGIQKSLRRRYPLGDLAPQLIGYTTQIASREEYEALRERHRTRITHSTSVGRCGLEGAYNWRLHGDPGRRVLELDGEGSFTKIVSDQPPEQGRPLRLSLDAQVTRDAERILEQRATVAGYLPKGRPSGAFVLMDADTGELLVWGEAPRYNLNVDLSKIYDPVRASAIADREEGVWNPHPRSSLAPDMDLETFRREIVKPVGETMSRISQVAVEPGSTFKPLIGLGMLSSGLTLPHASFYCGGGDIKPGCHDCGTVGLELAITKSCNRYFAFSLRDSRHWTRYRHFLATFIQDIGIGQAPGDEIGEWATGTWLQRDGYDFPLEVALEHARERLQERAERQRRADEDAHVVVPEIVLSRSPRSPTEVGGDPKRLGSTIARVATWVARHSGAERLALNVSQERVEGSRVVLKFGLRAARRPAFFALPGTGSGRTQLPPALRGRSSSRAGVAGRIERGGTVWFTGAFDRRMGRKGPSAPPVIRPDDGRNVAIGQGPVLATPLQMVRAMGVIANGGTLVEPHVVPDLGRGPRLTDRKQLNLSARHLRRIRDGMYGVANSQPGTADDHPWHRVPARVYAKTGTAQVGKAWVPFDVAEDEGPWHHWFVGFAEAPGKRTVAFACLLHARLEGGAGATAAPATLEILERWFASPLSDARTP